MIGRKKHQSVDTRLTPWSTGLSNMRSWLFNNSDDHGSQSFVEFRFDTHWRYNFEDTESTLSSFKVQVKHVTAVPERRCFHTLVTLHRTSSYRHSSTHVFSPRARSFMLSFPCFLLSPHKPFPPSQPLTTILLYRLPNFASDTVPS